jgi:hypothetical protein
MCRKADWAASEAQRATRSNFPTQCRLPYQSISQPRRTAAGPKPFQINALNLVGKIGLPSSFGEISRIRRENAGMFRLSTIKVARKRFVFKGV